ncbi:hypothetical protein [Lysinibacillus sp. NPDC093688]|uniref:hypothetical protein n=1 Tax=Lysinibacillus sp. NPDC093688 TaxID=3390577 RepID=UPI003CFBF362
MAQQNWGLENVAVKVASVAGLNWLPQEHYEQLNKLFKHLKLENYLGEKVIEQSAIELKLVGVKGIVQEVKFSERTKLEITSGDGLLFFAKLLHTEEVENEDGTYNQHLVAIEDGLIIVERIVTTTSKTVVISDLIKSLNLDGQDVSAQAWYDSIPCVANGCCAFADGPIQLEKPVVYKWCGANCGSGTPVNAADNCCRTHDYCYSSFPSYPNRCSCDRNLQLALDVS